MARPTTNRLPPPHLTSSPHALQNVVYLTELSLLCTVPHIKCGGYFTVIRGDERGHLMPERTLVAEGIDFGPLYFSFSRPLMTQNKMEEEGRFEPSFFYVRARSP